MVNQTNNFNASWKNLHTIINIILRVFIRMILLFSLNDYIIKGIKQSIYLWLKNETLPFL